MPVFAEPFVFSFSFSFLFLPFFHNTAYVIKVSYVQKHSSQYSTILSATPSPPLHRCTAVNIIYPLSLSFSLTLALSLSLSLSRARSLFFFIRFYFSQERPSIDIIYNIYLYMYISLGARAKSSPRQHMPVKTFFTLT